MPLLLSSQTMSRLERSCSPACSTSYSSPPARPTARARRHAHRTQAQNGKTDASEIDAWKGWQDAAQVPTVHSIESTEELADALATKQEELDHQHAAQRKQDWVEGNPERVYLVGVDIKRPSNGAATYTLAESLEELSRLAVTAGLQVVGQASQKLQAINPQTYLGPGKLAELVQLAKSAGAETIIFDDELSPRQLRALDKAFSQEMRVCDRTMLILDIFSQRAASREGQLQVALAQLQYQLPRLTRMWSHLERQAGGRVRGMGEKQLEVDKRLMRTRIGQLQDQIEEVRRQRSAHRTRRAQMQLPVVALVGYTNSGKSTLLNRLTAAEILAEDQLFATLDPTTRRLDMPSSTEVLMSDTVGFIQKLPPKLVAAFRATLEEIREASLILHVVDISHPSAAAQSQAVIEVLEGLNVDHVPISTVWNKIDQAAAPEAVRRVAAERPNTLAISARTGTNTDDLLVHIEDRLAVGMLKVQCLVPYAQAELLGEVRRWGSVQRADHAPQGTLLQARVPQHVADKLSDLALDDAEFRARRLALLPALAGTKPW